MSVMSSIKSNGKQVDVVAQEWTSQPPPSEAVQIRAQNKSLTQTSLTSTSREEQRREAKPQEPPIIDMEQHLRNAF